MAIKLGTSSIDKLYLGASGISKAYLGSALLYESAYTFTDADAEAYSDEVGILTDSQKAAFDACVIGLKADGAWTPHDYITIMKLNNSTANAVNLKNPATFDMTWVGGLTHSSSGVTGNGSTGYAYNGYVPSAQQTLTGQHFGVFVDSNNTPASADPTDLGTANSLTQITYLSSKSGGSNLAARMCATLRTATNASSVGRYIMSRIDANVRVYKNGSQVISGSGSGSLPTVEAYYWNLNFLGSPYADGWSNQTYTVLLGGKGLTAAQAADTDARLATLLAAI